MFSWRFLLRKFASPPFLLFATSEQKTCSRTKFTLKVNCWIDNFKYAHASGALIVFLAHSLTLSATMGNFIFKALLAFPFIACNPDLHDMFIRRFAFLPTHKKFPRLCCFTVIVLTQSHTHLCDNGKRFFLERVTSKATLKSCQALQCSEQKQCARWNY